MVASEIPMVIKCFYEMNNVANQQFLCHIKRKIERRSWSFVFLMHFIIWKNFDYKENEEKVGISFSLWLSAPASSKSAHELLNSSSVSRSSLYSLLTFGNKVFLQIQWRPGISVHEGF